MKTALIILFVWLILAVIFAWMWYRFKKNIPDEEEMQLEQKHQFEHLKLKAHEVDGTKFIHVSDKDDGLLGKIYEHKVPQFIYPDFITEEETKEISYIQMNFAKIYDEIQR